jgi:hypothetical protein
MSHDANTQSRDEMRAALQSVQQAQLAGVNAARPPRWLIALATAVLATILLGHWLMDDGSRLKAVVTGCASLVFVGTWGVHMLWLKRAGLKVRQIPSTVSGRLFFLGQALFMLSVIALTEWLVEKGLTWVPWVSTAVICLMFAVVLHRFPTGEPILRERR